MLRSFFLVNGLLTMLALRSCPARASGEAGAFASEELALSVQRVVVEADGPVFWFVVKNTSSNPVAVFPRFSIAKAYTQADDGHAAYLPEPSSFNSVIVSQPNPEQSPIESLRLAVGESKVVEQRGLFGTLLAKPGRTFHGLAQVEWFEKPDDRRLLFTYAPWTLAVPKA